MKQKGSFLLLFLLCVMAMQAQTNSTQYIEEEIIVFEKKQNYIAIGVEIGFDFLGGSFKNEKWPIRQDVSYYESYGGSYVHTEENSFYVGIKPEFIFQNGAYSIATGVRYRSMEVNLWKNGYNSNYFYLRYGNNSVNTKYARVNNVTESYDFIGIPLELKWAPLRFSGFSIYLKAGCDVYFKINSKIEVDFVNESMKREQKDILDYIGIDTNDFYSRIYGGLGISYTALNRMGVSLDVLLPVNLTNNNFTLIAPDAYSSIQLSFQVPLTK